MVAKASSVRLLDKGKYARFLAYINVISVLFNLHYIKAQKNLMSND